MIFSAVAQVNKRHIQQHHKAADLKLTVSIFSPTYDLIIIL